VIDQGGKERLKMKRFKMRHTIYGSETEFTDADAPLFLKGGRAGSTMDDQWFWDEHIKALRVGESEHTDYHEITCIDCGVSVAESDRDRVVFSVPINDHDTRYMRVMPSPNPDNVFVVMVDGEAFYHAWMACAQGSPADCVPREDMPHDSKYGGAVDGFERAQSMDDPVPLAECTPYADSGMAMIGFNNGVTRTLWLLANRVPVFPVKVVGRSQAELLNSIAGADRSPYALSDLFPSADEENLVMVAVSPDEHRQKHHGSEHLQR